MKHMLSLEELSLELPVDCSCIAWPDLSQLRVLHLGISGERNWKLRSLLPRLTLDYLYITGKSSLCLADIIAIGEILSPFRCPAHMYVNIENTFCIRRTDTQVAETKKESYPLLIEMIITENKNEDYYGYCIAHSSCHWILTFYSTEESNFNTLATAIRSRPETTAKVVALRGGKFSSVGSVHYDIEYRSLLISAENLNALFTDMKHLLSLEELSLELPVDCSCIAWPDLSRLKVLHLGISGKRNWNFSSLLPQLTLDSLNISGTSLPCLEDFIAVGQLLSPSRCPKNIVVDIDQIFYMTKTQPEMTKNSLSDPANKKNDSSLVVNMVIFDNCIQVYELGCCIAHSHCQWILTLGRIDIETLSVGTCSIPQTMAIVVKLINHAGYRFEHAITQQFNLLSLQSLNTLFTDMKHMLSLEELSLELPVDCSCIAWPDLSRLRVLHLGICEDRNWKLSSLLPHLTLDELIIIGISTLHLEDCISIGEMLSSSMCPKHVHIMINQKFRISKTKPEVRREPSSDHENKVVMEISDNDNQDNLGYCIAHSSCQWVLILNNRNINIKTVVAGASSKLGTSARVVILTSANDINTGYLGLGVSNCFQPLLVSAVTLNTLFTDMKHMLSLEELSLQLPVDCSCIAWPDLSRLRVLHLGISGERNWKLSSLLHGLKLITLKINIYESVLCREDCIALAQLLLPSSCLENVYIEACGEFCITSEIQFKESQSPLLAIGNLNTSQLVIEMTIFDNKIQDYLGYCIA